LFYRAIRVVFPVFLCVMMLSVVLGSSPATAAQQGAPATTGKSVSVPRQKAPPAPPAATGARLIATPALVDVGDQVTLTLTATHFTPRSSVAVRFLSAHHGFSGPMPWDPQCNCFRLAILLAKRSHPLEQARASAIITVGKSVTTVSTAFQIRGLTANGLAYAPGGTPLFSAWVGDPSPVATEFQHYCVWARTADALGVSGLTVKLSVHFGQHTENWTAGVTGSSGVLCVRRSIGHPRVGTAVRVDAYAGTLHAQTSFTPVG
jgi:hypothetical protein